MSILCTRQKKNIYIYIFNAVQVVHFEDHFGRTVIVMFVRSDKI